MAATQHQVNVPHSPGVAVLIGLLECLFQGLHRATIAQEELIAQQAPTFAAKTGRTFTALKKGCWPSGLHNPRCPFNDRPSFGVMSVGSGCH